MKRKNKKLKYVNNTFLQTVLDVFKNNPLQSYNMNQLYNQLNISDRASKDLVKEMVSTLYKNGSIVQKKRGKYQIEQSYVKKFDVRSMITGTVDMKQTGKAYIISRETPEDVFIAANNTGNALHGDKVRVRLFPKRRSRKLEGEIVEVLERASDQFVGMVEISKGFAFLIPQSKNMPVDIFIPENKINGAKNGEKAIARITDWPKNAKNPFGEITEVIGKPGNNEVEMQSILASWDFPLKFPDKVIAEADKIPSIIPEEDIRQRKDFRNVFTCTIDPYDAKDFDDALSLRKLENGHWEIGVHIADVSHYVKPGSALDEEAYERGTSVYLVDRVIPMLPEKLSNMVCSLRPNEDSLCFSAIFEIDENAKLYKEWFGRTIIHSDKRYNYEEVQQVIEGGDDEYKNQLLLLDKVAKVLRRNRFQRGSIAFNSKEVKFKLDENGKPISAYVKVQKDSNKLIEEFMLLANRRVATKVGKARRKNPYTFVYRIHDTPNMDKLTTFADFIYKLGYRISMSSRKSISTSLNNLFKEIEGKGEENMIESIAIRTMSKAIYSTHNIGHYGLAFDFYTHFTSPIRRYPDLMVHRLLQRFLDNKKPVDAEVYEEKCEHSSDMEKKAAEAERESVKYKQAEYLMDKIGQEFDGLISGVSKWGIFVVLEDNFCEGMVSLKNMKDDFYFLDEDNYQVVGQKYGNTYKLGDKVRIIVRNVDLMKREMDFEVVEE